MNTPSFSLEQLSLYHSPACPYCHRVRHAMADLDIDIALKDISADDAERQALIEGGGKKTVPCLRIETAEGVTWMYESQDIIDFLQQQYG